MNTLSVSELKKLKEKKLTRIYPGRTVEIVTKNNSNNLNALINLKFKVNSTLSIEVRREQNDFRVYENILKLSSKFNNIIKYHEREILENQDNFFEGIFSGSLFYEDKFVIINQASDKIVRIIEILIEKKEKIKKIAI